MSFLDKLVGDTTEKVQATGNSLNQLAEMFKDIKMQRTWKQFNQLDDKSPEAIRTFQKQHGLGFDQMAALINGEVEYKQFENLLNQSEWAKKNQGMSESLDAAKLKGMGLDNQTKQAALDYFNKTGNFPGKGPSKPHAPSKGDLEAAKNIFYKTQGWVFSNDGLYRKDKNGNLVPVSTQEQKDADIMFQQNVNEELSSLKPGDNFLDNMANKYSELAKTSGEASPPQKNIIGRFFDDIDNAIFKQSELSTNMQKEDQANTHLSQGLQGIINKYSQQPQNESGNKNIEKLIKSFPEEVLQKIRNNISVTN